MIAVVDIAGQQFKVTENTKYYVPKLKQETESEITFDKVYLLSNGKETKIGNPVVQGAQVKAKIISHLRDDKVLVFKKKRRKGYRKLNGHRQNLTRIEVTSIG